MTPNQKKILKDRLHFTSLVLYKYLDTDRTRLDEFGWQLCGSSDIVEVGAWLKNADFPSLKSSRSVLAALSRAEIGTADKEIIDRIICPPTRTNITIEIGWKSPPSEEICVRQRNVERAKIRVLN